ncbi:Uu.00g057550.m01.CDS01 [Anthostomella pinea]|uniref:Uu.00g057550.m01.CDS01 n=1 Tax=Anthostomella pinea TaxID=933095 RepID=A0AAI8VRQ7_9PEZI|nr:Uu.00g057550.m01.CDS01 [Anthostomella pinea]
MTETSLVPDNGQGQQIVYPGRLRYRDSDLTACNTRLRDCIRQSQPGSDSEEDTWGSHVSLAVDGSFQFAALSLANPLSFHQAIGERNTTPMTNYPAHNSCQIAQKTHTHVSQSSVKQSAASRKQRKNRARTSRKPEVPHPFSQSPMSATDSPVIVDPGMAHPQPPIWGFHSSAPKVAHFAAPPVATPAAPPVSHFSDPSVYPFTAPPVFHSQQFMAPAPVSHFSGSSVYTSTAPPVFHPQQSMPPPPTYSHPAPPLRYLQQPVPRMPYVPMLVQPIGNVFMNATIAGAAPPVPQTAKHAHYGTLHAGTLHAPRPLTLLNSAPPPSVQTVTDSARVKRKKRQLEKMRNA